MRHSWKIKALSLLLFASTLFSYGCYDIVAIKPTEITKLNNTYSVQVGTSYSTSYNTSTKTTTTNSSPIMAHSVRHLERPDGRTLQVTGKTPVIITTNQGKYTFTHPTISRLNDGNLIIAGSNRGYVSFPLESIQKAEVKMYNAGKTLLTSTLLSVLLCVPLFIMAGK